MYRKRLKGMLEEKFWPNGQDNILILIEIYGHQLWMLNFISSYTP